ncbi:hypothetical protein ERJ75_000624500 [Trypanosoma vivax]|nr:hypothetical protein ERJ75_000624500 [Trypanosoma vivax]
MLRYVLGALACTCAKEAKGLEFDTAGAVCNTATVLAGISAAAESAAADMKRRRGFLSSWRRVASEVSEETQNLTVAGEAEKLERVAEGMGDIEHEALAVAGDAARTSVRLTDFVKLFATFSGSVNGGGKTCIGKATGSGQDAATTNGPADYIYADLGCDVSPEEMATMKAHIIQHGPHLRRWHTNDQGRHSQRPGSTARKHCNGDGRQHRRRRERMPTRNAQGTQKCRHRRRHRGSEQRGNGAQGRLGRPHRNDTKQHQHRQRHKRRLRHNDGMEK